MRKNLNVVLPFIIILLIIVPIFTLFYTTSNNIIKAINTNGATDIQSFSSYDELMMFLNRHLLIVPLYKAVSSMQLQEATQLDYSKTNVQVEGIDELDTIKTDGKYLYAVSNNTVYVIAAYPPDNAKIETKIILNRSILGIFLFNNELVIISNDYSKSNFETNVRVYNIENKRSPKLIREFSINGLYFTSRAMNDYVYLIAKVPIIEPSMYGYPLNQVVVNIPKIKFNNEEINLPASQIYHFISSNDTYYEYTVIMAFNVKNDEKPTVGAFLLGDANNLYMSFNNLYITSPVWNTYKVLNTKSPAIISPIPIMYEKTLIYRFSINNSDIRYETKGEVSGTILNQFSMDEFNNYFRVVTTVWKGKPENNIYILDMKSMKMIGNITGLAPGEWVYSARFVNDRCYLVTFKKTDPLFVIDIENASNPKVLGWLKIPGYSNYLHPYDATHIIGIGKETMEAENGDFAWYQGVKISLFDVSDPQNPKEISKYIIGDRGSNTPVLRDHKALLFDKSRKILALPVLVAQKDNPSSPPDEFGKPVWQGAYIFNVSLEKGLILIGKISHLNYSDTNYNLFNEKYFVKRIIYINNALYTISDKVILINNLTNISEIMKKIILN